MSVKKRRTKLIERIEFRWALQVEFVSDIERFCDTDGHHKLKLEYMWFNHWKKVTNNLYKWLETC